MTDLTDSHGRHLLHQMIRIRRMEERCAELYTQTRIRGFLHLAVGEEAVGAGLAEAVRPDDAVVATYREHGHALLKGVSMRAIMAEMFAKVEGCSRGRGGSMHLFDAGVRFYGGNAIVGGGMPVAAGLALADLRLGHDRVTFCIFGEGAMAEGVFHETANLAALWNLPVVFCCENNLYAMGTALARSESETDLCLKAAAYQMPAWPVDGMDVTAVEAATRKATASARSGGGPHFLEFRTYRFRAHSMYDPELYRDPDEVREWRENRDPIQLLTTRLRVSGAIDDDALAAIEADVAEEISDAVSFAEQGTDEDPADLLRFVHSERAPEAVA